MEDSNEFIDKFVELFQQALSNDDSIRECASDEILELQSTNTLLLVNACVSIINSDSVPLTSQLYSFVLLCNIFRPSEEIMERYQHFDEQIKTDIRTSFLRGLLFTEPEVYNQAAYLVSLIYVIDDSFETIQEIFKYLRDLAISDEHSESAHYAAIIAYREIYLSGHIKDESEYYDILIQQKTDLIEFLKYGYNYPITFITEVTKTLKELINYAPKLFDSEEGQGELFEIFELMLPQVFDVDLFREIFILLFDLTGQFYGKEILDIERIITITSNGISCDNLEFVSISIDFWVSVANKEIKMKENNDTYERCQSELKNIKSKINQNEIDDIIKVEQKCCDYCILFAEKSITDVLTVLTRIDQDDVEIEDNTFNQPYRYAVSLIRKIFCMNQELVIDSIEKLYDESVNSEDWTIRFAFLKALSTLTPIRDDNARELLEKSNDFIIECAYSEIDRLSQAAVLTLQRIAGIYPFYSTEENLTQIMEVIADLLNRDLVIASESLILLQKVVKHKCAPVDKYFQDLIKIPKFASERDDFNASENMDFENPPFFVVFDTFNSIIINSTEESIEKVHEFLINDVLDNLQKVTTEFQTHEVTSIMQHCLLQTIGKIFKKFLNYLEEDAKLTLDVLFELIVSMNKERITDDVLLAITYIIPSLEINNLIKFKEPIVDYIRFTLTSGSPSIIKNSIIVIANFFNTKPNLILEELPSTIDLIKECLENQYFTPDFYPEVALNLSYIIEAISRLKDDNGNEIPKAELERYFDADIRDIMFDIYQKMSTLPLDSSDENGNEFANSILECTMLGFARIIAYSHNDPNFDDEDSFLNSRNVMRDVFKPVKLLASLDKVADNTLLAFLELIYYAIMYFGKRKPVFIAKDCHYCWIIRALASNNTELKERAKTVWNLYIEI